MQICKYTLGLTDRQSIDMPGGSTMLSVGVQQNVIVLWVSADPNSEMREYTFYLVGTGRTIPENSEFVGTVQMDQFVWHVFKEVA